MKKENPIVKRILMVFPIVFGMLSAANAQSEGIRVNYKGQRPTISDFVTAILSQDDLGEMLGGISDEWKRHQQGRKTDGEFTVNTQNGYIRYDFFYSDEFGRTENTTEFCYWNCKDNRHKLVAVNDLCTRNGCAVFTENTGLMLYMYDSQTHRMTDAYLSDLGLEHDLNGATTYSLPITDKDILATVHLSYGQPDEFETVIKFIWDGMKFHQEKKAVQSNTLRSQAMKVDYDVSLRIVDEQGEKPGYEAIVRLNGKTLQVLEARVEDRPSKMDKFGNVIQKDVNFDGIPDLLICLGGMSVTDQTFMYYDAWIAQPGASGFTLYKDFRDISNAEVDTANKRILSHYLVRDGVTYNYSALRWQNGQLKTEEKSWNVKKKLVVQ